MSDDFGLPVAERWGLGTRHLGPVRVCAELDSTNARLLALAGRPGTEGLALLARSQTAGRGQYGRAWAAPAGSGVLLSVLVYPPARLCRPARLTAWAAVSVCEVAGRFADERPAIKWPNDVLLGGGKVCGILIETAQQAGRLAAVVGIGLNVTQRREDFAAAGLPLATSLCCHRAAPLDSATVARALVGQLDEEYDRLLGGDEAAFEARWRGYLGLAGDVVAECHDGERRGRLVELGLERVVLWGAGGPAVLAPESIRHLRAGACR